MQKEQIIEEVKALNKQIERLEARKHDLLLLWGQFHFGDRTAAQAEEDMFNRFTELNADNEMGALMFATVLEHIRTIVQPDSPAVLWILEYERLVPLMNNLGELLSDIEGEVDDES